MGSQARPVRSSRGKDDPDGHELRLPASCLRHLPYEPALPVDTTDEVVDVDDVRLEFDHEDGTAPGMPGKDVDDPTFSIDRERDLRFEDPFRVFVAEHPRDVLMKGRMPGIQEPIEITRPPTTNEIDPDIQGRGDPPDRLERQRAHVPTLQP